MFGTLACAGRGSWVGLLTLLLFLQGCASGSLKGSSAAPSTFATAPEQWRVSGRFGIRNDENSWNGSLAWSQQKDVYDIVLSAPLGLGAVALRGNSQKSELELAPDQIYSDGNAERLLYDHLGWYIPFDNLRFWLTGHSAPGIDTAASEFDDHGRLKSLQQDDWVVEFKRYVTVGGVDLPDKIFMTHPVYNVRFVVDRWELPG